VSKPQANLCRVCRKRPADTSEHFIPQSAGNRGRVDLLVMNDSGSYDTRRCTRGFYAPVLCSTCNNGPCSVYAQAYTSLIAAVRASLGIRAPDGRLLVRLRAFYSQRFVKHLVSMFLCAVPWEPAPVWTALQDYVLDRLLLLPSTAPRLFLYRNTARIGRIVPCCGMVEFATGRSVTISEISWPPLGVVYAYEWHEKFRDMYEVTSWGQEEFDTPSDQTVLLPDLAVNTHFPLAYGSRREVELDERRRLPAYLMHVPPGPLSPTAISALVRKAGQS
jgi:hypothetical protein